MLDEIEVAAVGLRPRPGRADVLVRHEERPLRQVAPRPLARVASRRRARRSLLQPPRVPSRRLVVPVRRGFERAGVLEGVAAVVWTEGALDRRALREGEVGERSEDPPGRRTAKQLFGAHVEEVLGGAGAKLLHKAFIKRRLR